MYQLFWSLNASMNTLTFVYIFIHIIYPHTWNFHVPIVLIYKLYSINTLTSVYIFIRIIYLRKIEFHTQFRLPFKITSKYIYTNHETSIPYTNSVYTKKREKEKKKKSKK